MVILVLSVLDFNILGAPSIHGRHTANKGNRAGLEALSLDSAAAYHAGQIRAS
jgi:hypothetical protein